jgi:hypothetical protein
LKYATDPATAHFRYAGGEINHQSLATQDIPAPCDDDVADSRMLKAAASPVAF